VNFSLVAQHDTEEEIVHSDLAVVLKEAQFPEWITLTPDNLRWTSKHVAHLGQLLAQQGVPESSTTAAGFGKTRPIASNATSEGRQQNRRVELVVSGEVIGTKIGSINLQPIATATSPQS
jgi:hypothetical protein